MVEAVLMYKSNDVLFETEDKARKYDTMCEKLDEAELIKEPADGLIELIDIFSQHGTHSHDNLLDKYSVLFREHKPCAFCSSLYRLFSDYRSNYPRVLEVYFKLMNGYINKYGEK